MYFTKSMKIKVVSIIAIMMSILFIQAFSTFVPGMVAIQLDKDDTILKASETLQENVPEISVIEYGSFKYHFMAHRIIQPLVWIGHGDEEGISINEERQSWTQFSKEIINTPATDVILSCYSNEIVQQSSLTEKDVVTFNGEIDSTLGGLIVAYLLTGSDSITTKATHHYLSLLLGETQYQPLGPIVLDPGPGGGGTGDPNYNLPNDFNALEAMSSFVFLRMSGIELSYWIIMFFVLLIEIVLSVYCSFNQFSFLREAAAQFFIVGIMTLIISFAYYNDGCMSFEELTENILGAIYGAFEIALSAINNMSAGEIILFLLYCGLGVIVLLVEIFLDITAAGLGTFLRIVIAITLTGAYILGFIEDMIDYDYVVG